MSLTVIILTKNEERHIGRAMASSSAIADRFFVVDSGSSDRTVELASAAGANVLYNPFITQAKQFNWALEQLPPDTDWILRLDADEYLTPALAAKLKAKLDILPQRIVGVYVARRIAFLGKPIRWGGVCPISSLRLFRFGAGRCENRWMDEHIVVKGDTIRLGEEIIDDNKNSISWWTEKHNAYASREVVDLLNLEYGFSHDGSGSRSGLGVQSGIKRFIKERVYSQLPGGIRAAAYFFYRFILRLGFLDGRAGIAFHVLQGFWYRYLVDVKMYEVKSYMRQNNVTVATAIRNVLGLEVERK